MKVSLDRWLSQNPMPGSSVPKAERAEYFARMPASVEAEWAIRQAKANIEKPGYNQAIADRAEKRMARVDAMPPELRKIVYEYGLEIVQEFLNCGIKIPSRIAHLIDTVRGSTFPNGQARFKINKGPSAKQNPTNYETDDDDEYYIPRANRR